MAERSDDGRFQINDIELDIPPEQIQVARESVNSMWQTLRTRSSIKTKSGLSTINVSLNVKFTSTITGFDDKGKPINGLSKLRDLVSQFRVTPFCYVENLFLRNSILDGASSPNMALALKQMQIVKVSSPSQGTNTIDVTFRFVWFNYLPYLRDFSFKQDFFSGIEVKDPRQSKPWKMLYQAEQRRLNYDHIPRLDGRTNFSFTEFSQMQIKRYQTLQRDYRALQNLREQLNDGVSSDVNSFNRLVFDSLKTSIGNENQARTLAEEIVGKTTSMKPSKSTVQNLIQSIDTQLSEGLVSLANENIWSAVILNDSSIPRFKDKPQTLQDNNSPEKEDVIMLERKRQMDLDNAGLIVTNISVSFENILANIPLVGHMYPTFQHIGSIDAIVTMSIMTTNESSIRALSNFYSIIEDQALKFKQVPQGQRNLIIRNDIINMCGLSEFIPNSLVIETVPGQPGTYAATLELIDNPLTTKTREQITEGQSFTTTESIRSKIAEVILQNLALVGGAVPSKKDASIFDFGGIDLRSLKENSQTGKRETGYYVYTGKRGVRHQVFQNLCEQFGREMGSVFANLVEEFMPVSGELATGPLAEFFSLTNDQVFGIEVIQEDMLRAFQVRNKALVFGKQRLYNGKGNVTKKLLKSIQQSASDIIAGNDAVSLQKEIEAKEKRAQEGESGSFIENIKNIFSSKTSKVATFINDELSNWMRFSTRLLDDIILKGYLSLEQFSTLEGEIKQASTRSSGNCYPDFPLQEVVDLLRESDDKRIKNAMHRLETDAVESLLSFRNAGVSSLIGPDFYFFSHQSDTIESLVPHKIMQEASQALSTSQGIQRQTAEKQWFNNVYNQQIVGANRAEKIEAHIYDQVHDSEFWNNEASSKQKEIQSALVSARQEASVFQPNDLLEIDSLGLGPSLYEHASGNGSKYGPITLADITDDTDLFGSTAVRREGAILSPNWGFHAQCKHHFGLSTLKTHHPSTYEPPNSGSNNDPNNTPMMQGPIARWENRITSRPNYARKHPVEQGKVRPHKGIDFSCPVGTQVKAAADGSIVYVGDQPHGAGHYLVLSHAGGYRTHYFHLSKDKQLDEWASIINTNKRDPKLQVKAGTVIAASGNSGSSSGPHLHFEVWKGQEWLDPEKALRGDFVPVRKVTSAIDANNDTLLSKSVEQFEKDMHESQGYTMARAYPTFRFYFIESDQNERKRFAFDDMFSYSSVRSIHLVRSRKIAADLLVLELTNVSGVLSNRTFNNAIALDKQGKKVKEQPRSAKKTNTKHENPIASLNLQPGIQVQMRLGYSSNPEDLEIVFNGVIADAAFNESDDLVTLTCQSFAIELVKNIHGEAKSYGGFLSAGGRTSRVLEELLAMPEVVHFGRWEGGEGNLGAYRDTINRRWRIVPSPNDDNIFAPTGRGIFGIFDSTEKYTLVQSTIWDVFQEMTLRHPGYIASPVPYKGKYGDRMTMFFGVPDQMYFARDPDHQEMTDAGALRKQFQEALKKERDATSDSVFNIFSTYSTPSAEDIKRAKEGSESKLADKQWLDNTLKRLGMNQGIIKPFRNYHVLTSTNHIIYNNIASSGYNTFNTVTLQYGDDEAEVSEASGGLKFGDLDTFTLKSDAGLPDEEVKELFAQYPNCVGYEMAKRYTVSLLWWALKEGYKGNIITIGNPKIKPFDICYLFDEYSDMFGPIEVESVVHKFSQQNGFVTEITPDMILHVNQAATMSTSDAMGLMVEHGLKTMLLQSLPSASSIGGNKILNAGRAAAAPLGLAAAAVGAGSILSSYAFAPIANMLFNSGEHTLGTGASTNPFGMVGTFIFKKLITRTQLAHPFRASPLVKNGRSMLGGLPNRRTDGSFTQDIGNWFKDSTDGVGLMLTDTYDKMHPNNWFGRTTGSFTDAFLGDEE
jgi:murein DD-endopeptidase MepM/ murein hydrolase activator NlpD